MKEKSFSKMMEEMLNERLKIFLNKPFTKSTMMELYTTIFNLCSDIFIQSNVVLSNEAVNLISQMYYEDLKVNSKEEKDVQIYTQKAKLENIPSHELFLMMRLWKDHIYGQIFFSEIKKR